jgi:hypothetical protein
MSDAGGDDRHGREADEIIAISIGFLNTLEGAGKSYAFVATTILHMLATAVFSSLNRDVALETAHAMLDEMVSELVAEEMKAAGTLN